MPTLSSILVQRGVATMRAVEDAIARQVLHGGDLPTNLLELGSVEEGKLASVLAETFGIPVAPVGKFPAPPASVLRLLPGELAARHVVFPLALEGRTLELVVAEPLSSAVEDDLAFALDVSIRQHLAPFVRIRQAIADCYGIPLDRRLLRLVARLDGRPDPSPSSMPPAMRPDMPVKLPRGVSIPAPTFGTGVLEPADKPSARKTEPSAGNDAPPPATTSARPEVEPTNGAAATDAPAGPTPASEPPSRRAPSSKDVKALALFLKRAIQSEATTVADKKVPTTERKSRPPRRRGPVTAATAEREMADATTSDEVLDAFFAFAHQFFEYCAIFVVHGEHAEGRDASGPGADRAQVAGTSVLLEQPSAFAVARERKAPVLARFDQGSDAELLHDLGRGPRPHAHAILVLPLLVRGRAVAMLFGDDGGADVVLGELTEVTTLAGIAGTALERVAVLKKRRGDKASDRPKVNARAARMQKEPTSARGGALALARAIGTSGSEHATPIELARETPEPVISPGAESVREPEDPRRIVVPSPVRSPVPSRTGTTLPFEAVVQPKRPSGPDQPARHTTQPGLAPVAIAAKPDPEEPVGATELVVPAVPSPTPPAPPVPSDEELLLERASKAAEAFAAPRRRTPPAAMPASLVPRAPRERPIPREDLDDPRAEADSIAPRSQAPQSISNVKPMESARTPIPNVPSVIVDVNAEYNSLLQKVIEGGAHEREAFAEIVKNAEVTTALVMARFPGPLRVDRHRARGELPAASQCGPVLELVVALRRHALPFMTKRTTSPDVDVRFWATHVLGELRYAEAANVLMPRLFDDDVAVRRVARRSAASLVSAGDAGAPLLTGLDHMTRNPDQPVPHRVLAIETMGEIRTGALVPPLVAALRDTHDEVVDAARRSLLMITRQDFGRDERRWLDWWQRNQGRHRIEWLIDALMHEQPAVRRAAGDELKSLTKEYYGYYDDLPKKERERAQALYREWWEREGRVRF